MLCGLITAIAVVAAIAACIHLAVNRVAMAGALAALTVVLATVPFTVFNRFDRTRRSGLDSGLEWRKSSAPMRKSERAGWSFPSRNCYTTPAHTFRHFVLTEDSAGHLLRGPATTPGFTQGWIIAYPDELKNWRKQGTIIDLHPLPSGKDTVYVGWFAAKK